MKQPELKLITFDLGNVLVKVDHLEFCRRLAGLTAHTTEEIFHYVFNSSLEPEYDTGKISSLEFYQQIVDHFKITIHFQQFTRWWNSLFSPIPEMEEVVTTLAGKYPLFLLSNTNALHFDYIFENYPILKLFSEFVLSYKIGSRKPESGIYAHLIRQSKVLPAQILFIDDKLPFVVAAQQHGIQAWQFTSPEVLKQQLMAHGLS